MRGQEPGSGGILRSDCLCDMLPVAGEVPKRRASMSRGHPGLLAHLRRPFPWVLLRARPLLQKVRWGPHCGPFLWSPASGHGLWYPVGLAGAELFVLSPVGPVQQIKYSRVLFKPCLGSNTISVHSAIQRLETGMTPTSMVCPRLQQ